MSEEEFFDTPIGWIVRGILISLGGIYLAIFSGLEDYYVSLQFTDMKLLSVINFGYLLLIIGIIVLTSGIKNLKK